MTATRTGPRQGSAIATKTSRVSGGLAEIAFQHYVLARVAKQCGYWHAAASSAHFAVELMLKSLQWLPQPSSPNAAWPGRGEPLTVAKLRDLGHRLDKMWALFQAGYPDHPLGEFSEFVAELDRWGAIRYAQLVETGVTVFAPTLDDAARSRAANIGKPDEVFALDMPTLDWFYRGLLDVAGITFHLRGAAKFMVLDGRHFHEADNPSAIR
jgi:hypothetical protein